MIYANHLLMCKVLCISYSVYGTWMGSVILLIHEYILIMPNTVNINSLTFSRILTLIILNVLYFTKNKKLDYQKKVLKPFV